MDQRGEESNANKNNNNNGEEGGGMMKRKEEEFSAMTKETVSKIKRLKSTKKEAPMCTIHDNTSPGYGWLLPGWVAQERHMDSGRVYRVYIVIN